MLFPSSRNFTPTPTGHLAPVIGLVRRCKNQGRRRVTGQLKYSAHPGGRLVLRRARSPVESGWVGRLSIGDVEESVPSHVSAHRFCKCRELPSPLPRHCRSAPFFRRDRLDAPAAVMRLLPSTWARRRGKGLRCQDSSGGGWRVALDMVLFRQHRWLACRCS